MARGCQPAPWNCWFLIALMFDWKPMGLFEATAGRAVSGGPNREGRRGKEGGFAGWLDEDMTDDVETELPEDDLVLPDLAVSRADGPPALASVGLQLRGPRTSLTTAACKNIHLF